jgi:hypothetical protein
MRVMRIALLLGLLFPPLAGASPIFYPGWREISDGQTYDASQFSGSAVFVQNGALTIRPGADLPYVESLFIPGGPITMTGGKVDWFMTVGNGGINISGGKVGSPDYYVGSNVGALTVGNLWGPPGSASASISGGTFIGGYGNQQSPPGSAIEGAANSTLVISGGTFIGGTGWGQSYGGSSGYSLLTLGNTTVTGGNFQSPIAINGSFGGQTDFIGKNLTYQNGILSGLLQNGDPIHVPVYGFLTTSSVNSDGTEVRFLSTTDTGALPPPVPEPTSALVFGLLAGMGMLGRRSWARGFNPSAQR